MATLYLTDLDGTLLREDQTVSAWSVEQINRAIDQGVLFSVATARSLIGLRMLDLSGIRFSIPLVLMNGVMLYDMASRTICQYCEMGPDTAAAVLEACRAEGKYPFLYRVEDNDLIALHGPLTSEGERIFLDKRGSRFPHSFRRVETYPAVGTVFFSLQDGLDKLEAIGARLESVEGIRYPIYNDTAREENWYLEVFSDPAGKDRGARRLQQLVGADRLVAFGDNGNDLPMFRVADVACCVANGQPAAKEEADQIIGSNQEDGVARYLRQVLEE